MPCCTNRSHCNEGCRVAPASTYPAGSPWVVAIVCACGAQHRAINQRSSKGSMDVSWRESLPRPIEGHARQGCASSAPSSAARMDIVPSRLAPQSAMTRLGKSTCDAVGTTLLTVSFFKRCSIGPPLRRLGHLDCCLHYRLTRRFTKAM
jgi:hypothetical protein